MAMQFVGDRPLVAPASPWMPYDLVMIAFAS